MPKIKFTKSELKHQRDSLRQFQRFLPTLQLKKQQLQMEIRRCEARLYELDEEQRRYEESVRVWAQIFSREDILAKANDVLQLSGIKCLRRNIAGLDVPIFEDVNIVEAEYDLFETPPVLDDVVEALKKGMRLSAEKKVVERQIELISSELRITSQRVNLFEKVKIPEAKENIRIIQIYLGDEDTASVGRSKMAKRKMTEAA